MKRLSLMAVAVEGEAQDEDGGVHGPAEKVEEGSVGVDGGAGERVGRRARRRWRSRGGRARSSGDGSGLGYGE